MTGTLVEVDSKGNIINPNVATKTMNVVADAADGEWTMVFEFEEGTIKPLRKYVVFESAYIPGGEDENATKENPLTHKDVEDLAQTIVTEDEFGKIREDYEEGGETTKSIDKDEKNDKDEKIDETETEKEIETSKGSAKKGSSGPKTGDDSNAALYITAFAAAAGIAVTSVMLGFGRKRRRR